MGKIQDHSEANEKWKSQIQDFQQSNQYVELLRIDGDSMEFEWNWFPGITSIEILRKVRGDLEARNINPEQFEGTVLFMLMFNDIDWTQNVNSLDSISNSEEVREYAQRFQREHRSFVGPGTAEKWYGTHTSKLEGKLDEGFSLMIN